MLSCIATVTHGIGKEVIESLEMTDCETIITSPDRPNIFYPGYEAKPTLVQTR